MVGAAMRWSGERSTVCESQALGGVQAGGGLWRRRDGSGDALHGGGSAHRCCSPRLVIQRNLKPSFLQLSGIS